MNIKRQFSFIFKILYRLACLVLPKNKRKVVFISYPDAADNSWHLYRYMVSNFPCFQYVWLCSAPGLVRDKIEKITNGEACVSVWKKVSLPGLYNFLTSSYVFHTHGTYFFSTKSSTGPQIINLWHGMPIKAIGYLDGKSEFDICYSDYSISTSSFYSKIIANSFGLHVDKVLPFGLPRNDVFLNARGEGKEAIFKALNVPEQAKLIFWLPTYRVSSVGDVRKDAKNSSFLDDWDEGCLGRINELAVECGCFILIKIHPMDELNVTCPLLDFSRVRIIRSSEWQVVGVDLYEALAFSDALVTDFSSVLIDYIPTRKPIAITVKSGGNYLRETVLNLNEVAQGCFSLASESDFEFFLKNLDVLNPEREKLCILNSGTLEDAPSSKRILDYLGLNLCGD